ncbi:MAG: peptide chain release factor N(5)-glutamine methyltransferase [Phycisphaerales bacterium]|nr:peptide chain release factor N(5)-glutamine methyltransferase [Phycisphaerales bacterium]
MAPPSSKTGNDSTETTVWTTRLLLEWIGSHLGANDVDSPRPCAELLVSAAIGCDRLRLYMEPERIASDAERNVLRDWVTRAAGHEPVQYLVGEAWFHGRQYEVDPSTLIPRPSTELLVEHAVDALAGITAPRFLEIGTGTGCVTTAILDALDRPTRAESRRRAAAIADGLVFEAGDRESGDGHGVEDGEADVNRASAVAVELVPGAVALAERNFSRHGFADRVSLLQGSLYEPLEPSDRGTFDLLVSNPPYVSDVEWTRCAENVRGHEPESALRGGPDGLAVIRPLLAEAASVVRAGGVVAIEIQYDQGEAVQQLFLDSGLDTVSVHADHEGHERVVVGRRPE